MPRRAAFPFSIALTAACLVAAAAGGGAPAAARAPDHTPDHTPDRARDHAPDHAPDRAPDHAPDRAPDTAQNRAPDRARRVVSMNPSLTRMLIALEASDVLVGIDEYSASVEPTLAGLPNVGGLFDPSLEAVVALEPDLVVVVPSMQQRDFRSRLHELGIEVLELESITLDEIFRSLQALGDRVGRSEAAAQRVAAIQSAWRDVARDAAQRPRRSALFVVQRDPLFVVGGRSYLDAMLDAAGLDNAAAQYGEAYPRVSLEWLIASAPEVIIDSSADPVAAAEYWARWPSIPAVAAQRVVAVPQSLTTLPGPDLDRSLRTIVAALRGADAAAAAGETATPQ